jgi:hypothetical protein
MELLVGKYVAHAALSLVISAIVAALLVGVLGVPMLGGVLPFAGVVLPVEEFIQPVRHVSYLLPVTHGIETLQETMLRGSIRDVWMLGALGVIGVVLYLGSLLRLRRVIRSAA